MYLAFNGFTSQIPFFYGGAAFCRTWLEGTCYLLSKDSVPLFPPGAGWKPTSLSVDFCPQTEFFIPISSYEKSTTSGAKASANHLAPFSSSTGHGTQWPTFPSPPTRSQVAECKQPLAFHSDLDSLLRSRGWPRGIYLHSYPSFNGQSLALLVQTQKGRGNWSYFSPFSGIPRHNMKINLWCLVLL